VFPTLNSIYEKFFVANSVTSIYVRAGYAIPADWAMAQTFYGHQISESGVNFELASKAGLLVMQAK
jgi:hypothetical protein